MANPTLREGFINNSSFNSLDESSTMTVGGTILKTCFLGLLMFATFSYTWYLQLTGFLIRQLCFTTLVFGVDLACVWQFVSCQRISF